MLDTSFVLAHYNAGDPRSAAAVRWHAATDEDLVTTPLVLAEMDHVVQQRAGQRGRNALWRDLDDGAFQVRWWADALRESLAIARRHRPLGLADASLVALAGLLRTDRVATFDNHFRSVKTPSGQGLILLPDDA